MGTNHVISCMHNDD